MDSLAEKQVKELVQKEVKLVSEDLKKYTGPYGSWSADYLAKTDAERADAQKKLDQKQDSVIPG